MASREQVDVPGFTIETVDTAVKDWFDRTLDVHVESQTEKRHKVPVQFSSGERFVSARQKKGVRDKNGVLILPLISIRRTGIEASATMASMGVETANLQISRRVSPKTNTLQNANEVRPPSQRVQNPVVYEVTTVPFPDFSVLTYEVNVQSQYILQMNTILEKFFHELDLQKSFVMPIDNAGRHPPTGEAFEARKPFKGGYFVGYLEPNLSSEDNFEEFTDQERIIRYRTSFKVPTSLLLDPEGEKPSVKVERTAFNLQIGDEQVITMDDPYEIELLFNSRDPISAYREILKKRRR